MLHEADRVLEAFENQLREIDDNALLLITVDEGHDILKKFTNDINYFMGSNRIHFLFEASGI